MKKLLLILILAPNICVAQNKIALIITGYDAKYDDLVATQSFVDTSYWEVSENVNFKEIAPFTPNWKQVYTAYFYLDAYGTENPLYPISIDLILAITKQKLISLGKM